MYVDDVEVARGPQGKMPDGPGGLHIGTDSVLTPGTFWSALIDDVCICNQAVKP